MEFLADESVDYGIVKELRLKNITIHSISEDYSSINDSLVLEIANRLNSVLITEDKDFGELVFRLKFKHKGILLIRLSDFERRERIRIAVNTIIKHKSELPLKFSVLTGKGLRIKSFKN